MRTLPAAVTAARSQRAGIISHHLIWVLARDRATGNANPIGFWTGGYHREFVIGGQSRLYYGAGEVLGLEDIVQEIGLQVREQRIMLAGIAPAVETAMRGYELRFAPCQIHRAEFSSVTAEPLAAPEMVLDGEIGSAQITTAAEGEEGVASLVALSNAAFLTLPLTAKRSDESLRARAPNDAFLQYAKLSGSQGDPWGAKR